MTPSEQTKLRHVSEDPDYEEELREIRQRIHRIEIWQSFVLGAAAAVSALVAVSLTLLGVFK